MERLFTRIGGGLGAAVLLAVLAVFPGSSSARLVEKIVVVINGVPHTYSDLRKFTNARLRQDVQIDELAAGRAPKEWLEQFITEELIEAEVKGTGIRVGDEDIDGYIRTFRERNGLTLAQLTSLLRREGKDMARYREEVRVQIERGELIERNVRKKVHVTDRDARRYYDANPHLYVAGLKVDLRHLMLELDEGAPDHREQAVLARIRELRRQAIDGADFAALARAHSQGSGAGEGGSIGRVEPGDLPDPLAKVAVTLEPGTISQPVRTSLGYHLVRVEDREGGQRLGFGVVSEQVKEQLYEQTLEERFEKWLQTDLRKKHRVEVKLDGYAFEARQAKRGTVGNLMASSAADDEERGFWDYLNPLTYIFDEEVIRDSSGESTDRKVVSLFGMPLFTTDVGDDDDVPLDEPLGREAPAPPSDAGAGGSP